MKLKAELTWPGQDLSTVTAVTVYLRHTQTAIVTSYVMTITAQTASKITVQYQFTGTQTSVSGTYDVEFEATWPGNIKNRFPAVGYNQLQIYPKL